MSTWGRGNNNYRGGGRNSNNNNNYRGGGRGGGRNNSRGGQRRGGGGGRSEAAVDYGILRVCKNFTGIANNCPHNPCRFLHIVRLYAEIQASDQNPVGDDQQQDPQQQGNYRSHNNAAYSPISDIAIWEQSAQPGQFKIFTSSHDGYWRLWNTNGGQFVKEFEHNLFGKVFKCLVSHNYLIAGLEAPSGTNLLPVGQTHVWNLQSPQQPPTELHMVASPVVEKSIPYAHNMAVTSIHMNGEMIVTGSKDGSIRIWKFNQLQTSLFGHARDVTALALASNNTILWSSGMDHCIRIWNCADSSLQLSIATPSPVTALLPYQDTQFILTSTMDGSINVWKADTGDCLSRCSGSEGIICMCIAKDPAGNELLLTGMEYGNIQCRNITPHGNNAPALTLLFTLAASSMGTKHNGAVYSLTAGPAGTFYSGGADGKMFVMGFSGNVLESLR